MIKNVIIVMLLGIIGWLVWLIENDDSRYNPTKKTVKEKMHETVIESKEKTLEGLQKAGKIINETSTKLLEEERARQQAEQHQ